MLAMPIITVFLELYIIYLFKEHFWHNIIHYYWLFQIYFNVLPEMQDWRVKKFICNMDERQTL